MRKPHLAERWHIAGEYLENCNCEVLCPCLLGPRSATGALAHPTEGHCDVPVVFQIRTGNYGSVDLAGTHAAFAVYTPGPMGEGNWTFALYLDEGASPPQRDALERIFGGAAGGVMARVTSLVSTRLPTRVVPIQFGPVLGIPERGRPPRNPGAPARERCETFWDCSSGRAAADAAPPDDFSGAFDGRWRCTSC
jgi:hypothetical protein